MYSSRVVNRADTGKIVSLFSILYSGNVHSTLEGMTGHILSNMPHESFANKAISIINEEKNFLGSLWGQG